MKNPFSYLFKVKKNTHIEELRKKVSELEKLISNLQDTSILLLRKSVNDYCKLSSDNERLTKQSQVDFKTISELRITSNDIYEEVEQFKLINDGLQKEIIHKNKIIEGFKKNTHAVKKKKSVLLRK